MTTSPKKKVPTDPLGLADGKYIFCESCGGARKKVLQLKAFKSVKLT